MIHLGGHHLGKLLVVDSAVRTFHNIDIFLSQKIMKPFNSPIIVHISFCYHLIQLLVGHARAEKLANPDLTDTLFFCNNTFILSFFEASMHRKLWNLVRIDGK